MFKNFLIPNNNLKAYYVQRKGDSVDINEAKIEVKVSNSLLKIKLKDKYNYIFMCSLTSACVKLDKENLYICSSKKIADIIYKREMERIEEEKMIIWDLRGLNEDDIY